MTANTETLQLAAGYGVAGGTGSAPIWMNHLDSVLGIIAVLVAILVGLTTLYLNIRKIKSGN